MRNGAGSFTQGFVAAGCLSAFQDRPSPASQADVKRVLRHALQGGTALAAGSYAAVALRQQDYTGALVAATAGAAGVLLIERLLRDKAQANRENEDV
ncbi:MAG: hypothetical protein KA132_00510 [Thauera sp.]|nr:hypothetical protein [Thauera sp.]